MIDRVITLIRSTYDILKGLFPECVGKFRKYQSLKIRKVKNLSYEASGESQTEEEDVGDDYNDDHISDKKNVKAEEEEENRLKDKTYCGYNGQQ